MGHPADAASLAYSAEIMRWYWSVTHNLNSLADAYNMAGVTAGVLGAYNKTTKPSYQARCASFEKVLAYYGKSLPSGAYCAAPKP